MRTMTNPKEFCAILLAEKSFQTNNNFTMREYISSYGFRAPRELADQVMAIRDEMKSKETK